MRKFLILDGNSLVNRAFYGIRPLSTREGLPTNAVYGFLTIIKKHLDALKPDFCACAFDVHAKTFRHEYFPDYKGTRKGMPDELRAQMPYAKEAVRSLGFRILECPGYEADDIIGTCARLGDEGGDIQTYIVTGDRDSLQLITDRTTVILAKNKEDVYYTPENFEKDYGVTPAQYIDVKALMGDSSDNIPGVAGIGEKTAFRLISEAGSLDALYSDTERYGGTKGTIEKLNSGKESAFSSRYLATIVKNVPCCEPDDIFAAREPDAEAFTELCRKLEFAGMPLRFGLATEKQEIRQTRAEEAERKEISGSQLSEFRSGSRPVAVFLSEGGLEFTGDERTVYSCAGPDEEELRSFIRNNRIVCHDLKSLLRKLGMGHEKPLCEYDTMLACYLLNPGDGRYPLENCARLYSDPGLSGACCVYSVWKKTEGMLRERNMTDLMRNIEIPLAYVLAGMEQTGFKIDSEGIRKYAHELQLNEEAMASAIYMQAGHEFNINSPKQLGEVLFTEMGLPAGKKTKTGYSTDAETLESLRAGHQIVDDILQYRQIAKLRGTYGENLAATADSRGRIHTRFNQTGTATGRLASSEPNLQNIPVRGELGRELRKYFVADEGKVLIDADYSQIELRILASMADDENMINAFIGGEDIHASVASQVFGVPIDRVTPDLRRRAKAVNFGIVYGIGEFSLAKDLGISRWQAKEYIENYLSTYSGVNDYLEMTVAKAREDGYTSTLFGRRRYIPELKAKNRNLEAFGERVAMNSPIQGTAADVIKIAMINVEKALAEAGLDAVLIMQVHDELIVEADEGCAEEAEKILVREMQNAVSLAVPLTADSGVGKTWYEAK
ncbi:MAG: DNA polymerase I [Clostridia bacterium]|nr:DNA polymerase I [Clostridia bacterium]